MTQHPPISGDVPRIILWNDLSAMFTIVAYVEPDGRFSIRGEDKALWQS